MGLAALAAPSLPRRSAQCDSAPTRRSLASAHLDTERFVAVHERMAADHRGARATWARLESLVPLLFAEANPMPIKHCLWRQGLIASPECRLPLTRVSRALADRLDACLAAEDPRAAA